MRTFGIVRKIDELGRIVVPKEMRKSLSIENGDEVEILFTEDGILVKKYIPYCVFCSGKDDLQPFEGKYLCRACREKIGAMTEKKDEEQE
ncbi:MAG: AbrB/MazE/SpoVT family DNA-binding domain-containing protein [Ruminococcaceae bacterium]|nr:AbrB/MazE/SpoVT family DNA-binding domain-containing protein [Oscillospiraceae bacterium]